MASAATEFTGPQAAALLAEHVSRYRSRTVIKKADVVPFERPRPAHRRKSKTALFAVPPLTELALDALVRGFVAHPSTQGLPQRFASALAARLPANLDVRISAPHIHDEAYWRRAAVEGHGWAAEEVASHGQSWKQLCLEKEAARLLENFGLYLDLPPGYEEDFCRPPIDSTHQRWGTLYPKTRASRPDGRPNKERFCANALDDNETDTRIVNGNDTGWPQLEALKAAVRAQTPAFVTAPAWGTFDRVPYAESPPDPTTVDGLLALFGPSSAAAAQLRASVSALEAQAALAAAEAAAEAAAPKGKGKGKGDGGKKKGDKKGAKAAAAPEEPPPDPAAIAAAAALAPVLPYLPGGELHGLVRAAQRQWAEDEHDCRCAPEHLREFVPPDVVSEWRRTGQWPHGDADDGAAAGDDDDGLRGRGESILVLRARELQVVLDRLAACEDHVFSLTLGQLPSHMDLELILSRLPNLTALSLTYGMHRIGMRYDRGLFGMRPADAESLARSIGITDSLTSLSLPSNGIDDSLLLLLMTGLLANQTLTHLDLSHNAITSAGVQLLAKLLRGPCVLASLSLADNRADERAGRFLGKALRGNVSLTELNLRLNSLGDAGGAALLDALAEPGGGGCALTSLNLSSNHCGAATAASLAALLASSSAGRGGGGAGDGGSGGAGGGCDLASIDLSGNALTEADAALLQRAVLSAPGVTSLDLRGNPDIGPTSEAAQGVLAAARRNEVLARGGTAAPLTGVFASAIASTASLSGPAAAAGGAWGSDRASGAASPLSLLADP